MQRFCIEQGLKNLSLRSGIPGKWKARANAKEDKSYLLIMPFLLTTLYKNRGGYGCYGEVG